MPLIRWDSSLPPFLRWGDGVLEFATATARRPGSIDKEGAAHKNPKPFHVSLFHLSVSLHLHNGT